MVTDSSPTARISPATLTRREREVLVEIVHGRSNAEIGSRLFVTETTVKTHVTAILRKLDLPNRVHAVVYGYETGIVTPGAASGADHARRHPR
jgi:DNA-binding NarL/FixJ family response regulator